MALKVGQSELGAIATLAHTGALISSRDATDAYFRRHGVPTVHDYDELIAALETFATTTARPSATSPIAIAGISGGEAALTCDLAEPTRPRSRPSPKRPRPPARLAAGHRRHQPSRFRRLRRRGRHPPRAEALDVIAADPSTDTVFVLQDAQHSLAWRSLARYVGQCRNVAELGERTNKPIVVVSSSGEALHPEIKATLDGTDIPLLRGLRPALAAMRCIGLWVGRAAEPRRLAGRALSEFEDASAAHDGPLPADLTERLLAAYGSRWSAPRSSGPPRKRWGWHRRSAIRLWRRSSRATCASFRCGRGSLDIADDEAFRRPSPPSSETSAPRYPAPSSKATSCRNNSRAVSKPWPGSKPPRHSAR